MSLFVKLPASGYTDGMNDDFSHIIGHEKILHRLRMALKNDVFPHALLFTGRRHLGKRTLALAAAAALLGAERPEHHADFRLVERQNDEKSGKLKKTIPISEIRGLREHLQMTSFLGGRKVAVIDEADHLSIEAANGLLKTLEEPSGRTHLFLIAHDAERVPVTIRSRAAVIPFSRVPDSVLSESLRNRGFQDEDIARLTRFSAGRPGVALELSRDADMVHWYAEQESLWHALRREPLHRRFSLLAELAPPKSDREETARKLRDVFMFWETLLQRELRHGSTHATDLLGALSVMRSGLEINIQPRLLLEEFAMSLER